MAFFAGLYLSSIFVTTLLAVWPTFNTVLDASIFVLVFYLWMHALALKNGFSLASLKNALSLAL
jgi:hypothetical protein